MIGRELQPVRMGEIPESEHAHPFVPDLQRARHIAYVNFKKYEHFLLVAVSLNCTLPLTQFCQFGTHIYRQKIKMKNMQRNKKRWRRRGRRRNNNSSEQVLRCNIRFPCIGLGTSSTRSKRKKTKIINSIAGIAQLVEQRFCKAKVVGSNPSSGSKK